MSLKRMESNTGVEMITEKYKRLGWKLIRLNVKIPIDKNWQSADTSDEDILKHKGNIGLRTGTANNIVCIDCDGEGSEAKIMEFITTKTLTCKTPSGGKHFYFEYPKDEQIGSYRDIFRTKEKLGWAVDTRGDGGQAVIPPSAGYEWIHWVKPQPMPKEIVDSIKNFTSGESKANIIDILKDYMSNTHEDSD